MSLKNAVPFFGPAPWTPKTPGNLLFWFDASLSSSINSGSPTNGQNVTSWADQSGNGYNASQSTSGAYFTYKTNAQNGLPCLDGTTNSLSAFMTLSGSATPIYNGAWTLVFVVKAKATSEQILFAANKGTEPASPVIITLGSGQVWAIGANNAWFGTVGFTGSQITNNTNYKYYFMCNASGPGTASHMSMRLNGTTINGSTNGMTAGGSYTSNYLGDTGVSGFTWGGYLYEVYAYNKQLSSTDQTNSDNYILKKWGF